MLIPLFLMINLLFDHIYAQTIPLFTINNGLLLIFVCCCIRLNHCALAIPADIEVMHSYSLLFHSNKALHSRLNHSEYLWQWSCRVHVFSWQWTLGLEYSELSKY